MKQLFLYIALILASVAGYAQTNLKTPEEESNSSIEMGNIKAENGDWKGALNDYTNAIGYNPKNEIAYFHSGIAKQNLRDYRAAIVDFSRALYFNNSDAEAYFARGICYYLIGNKQKCCFDLTKALEFGKSEANLEIQNYCN